MVNLTPETQKEMVSCETELGWYRVVVPREEWEVLCSKILDVET